MLKEIIKWRPSLIGALIVAASYVAAYFSGESLLFSSFLLGGIIVGYMVNENWKSGAINGLISGIIATLIVNLFSIILLVSQGYAAYLTVILSSLVVYVVMELVLSAVGGIFGSLIRSESLPSAATAESAENEN
jgi:fructose-specific phosphotransferase system IIC component